MRLVLSLLVLALTADAVWAGPFARRRSSQCAQTATTSSTVTTVGACATANGVCVTASTFEQSVTTSFVSLPNSALDQVNAQRAARGLPPFRHDPLLTLAAERAAAFRATHRLFGHTSNDFAFLDGGGTATAAGCAAYPASYGFMACCVYERYTVAGAASVRGADGRMYHHIFVR